MAECQRCGAEVSPGRVLCDTCADKSAVSGVPLTEPSLRTRPEAAVGATTRRGAGRRRLALILGIVVLVVVVVAVALPLTGVVDVRALRMGVLGHGSSGGELSFVPSGVALCVSVDLEGMVKDAKPLTEIPELVREAIKKASGKDPLEEFKAKVGVDFKEEAVPALPRQFIVSVSEPGEGEAAPVVAFVGRPQNLDKAERLLEKFRKKAEEKGTKFSEEKYEGSLIVHATPAPGSKGIAYTFGDGHLVVSSSAAGVKAALDSHRSPDKALGKSEGFQALRKQLKKELDVLVYLDLLPWMQIAEKMQGLAGGLSPIPSAGKAPPGGPTRPGAGAFPMQPPKLSPEQMQLLKGTFSMVGVDVTAQGKEVESVSQPGEEMKKLMGGMAELPPAERGLLGRMPANPMGLLATTSPAKVWESVKGIYDAMPQSAFALNMLRMGLSKEGLDLEQDILGWMKGTAAAGLYYNIKPFPNLVIAWDVVNPEEVKGALTKIEKTVGRVSHGQVQFLEEQMEGATVTRIQEAELAKVPFLRPVLALTDKTLYFCSLESGLKSVLTPGEGSAADSVAELPKEAHSLGLIDFPAFSKFLLDLVPALAASSPGEKAATVGNVMGEIAKMMGCLGKATGFSQIRSDGSSLQRYVVPIDYEALVKVFKGWVEKMPAAVAAPAPAAP